jgi:hypothetical protein
MLGLVFLALEEGLWKSEIVNLLKMEEIYTTI